MNSWGHECCSKCISSNIWSFRLTPYVCTCISLQTNRRGCEWLHCLTLIYLEVRPVFVIFIAVCFLCVCDDSLFWSNQEPRIHKAEISREDSVAAARRCSTGGQKDCKQQSSGWLPENARSWHCGVRLSMWFDHVCEFFLWIWAFSMWKRISTEHRFEKNSHLMANLRETDESRKKFPFSG